MKKFFNSYFEYAERQYGDKWFFIKFMVVIMILASIIGFILGLVK